MTIDLELYTLSESHPRYLGACLSSGATVSLISYEQAEGYCEMLEIPLSINPRKGRTFKLGSLMEPSIGTTKIRVPYREGLFMDLDLDVVDINFPLLLGLDKLDQYKCYVNNVENIMVCVQPRWQHSITRKLGHLFYGWFINVLYTDNELRRINRHFYHPKSDKSSTS